MTLEIQTTNVLVDPTTYANRASALRAAKRTVVGEFKIEQVSGGRFMVMVPQDAPIQTVEIVHETADEHTAFFTEYAASRAVSVEPVAEKPAKIRVPNRAKTSVVTKMKVLHDLLLSGRFSVATLADKMSITTTAVNSLFSDLKRKNIAITAFKVKGAKAEYHVEA